MDIDYDGLPSFLIDCRSRQGQSGSPVIICRDGDYRTKDGNKYIMSERVVSLLGIYSGRINKESDLGIVWKTSLIKEIIEQKVDNNDK